MQLIDWIIVGFCLLIVFGIGLYTRRYLKSVSDFLTAGRGTGRYLLAVSRGELQGGAAIFVAAFEVISHSGFTLAWWAWINLPIAVFIATTGFVYYRYRETRVMTLAQFFELRYSKSFRLFAGFVGFFSGILNFAVIPVVGARIMCYFVNFPPTVTIFAHAFPTEILVLAVLLSITTLLTLSGGLITVVITNGVEGIISLVLYLVIIYALWRMFTWNEINQVLAHRPPGHSLLNPFDASGTKDFNIWYIIMGLFLIVYGTMAWQNQSAYNSAGTTPHESRMAGVIGRWLMYKPAMTVLLTVCAMAYLYHPHFAAQAAEVQRAVAQIPGHQTREQVLLPVALSHLLPAGVRGSLCVIFIMGIFGGDGAALHSWGSLFIQDILVPLRKKPFEPHHHIFYLRLSIIGVALFAFVFGSFFRQTEYLAMWWAVTMAVFVGGAGAAIIGGLYWKKGTTQGAWTAMLTGSILSVGGILLQQMDPHFPLNGIQVSFYGTLVASAVYVGVSLLTSREDFNMDRMLHRGRYAAVAASLGEEIVKPAPTPPSRWGRLIGLDRDFTRWDKWIAVSAFAWCMFWFGVLVVGSLWNLAAPWSIGVWSEFWLIVGIYIPVALTVVSSIWFTWGSLRDMRHFFRHLHGQKINVRDDGTVVRHHNLDESRPAAEARRSTSAAPATIE